MTTACVSGGVLRRFGDGRSRLKVLVVSKFWYARGGLERVMFDEIAGLEQRGHEVVHFSTAHPLNDPSPFAEYFVPYLEIGADGGLGAADKARAAVRMFANGEARRRFARLLDDTSPALVHIHGIHRQISPSILFEAAARGIPVVQTLHDYHHVCPGDVLARGGSEPCEPRACGTLDYLPAVRYRCVRGSLAASTLSAAETTWQRARRAYERTVTRFVSPSEFLAGRMTEGGWTIPIDIVPNAVDPGPTPVPPREGDTPYFLMAARLSPEKDVETALRAADEAGVRLVVAGDGPLRRDLARSFPNADLRGHVDSSEMRVLLSGCRATVISSKVFENAPMAVLEAMVAGRAVVASRIGGIPEIVRDGIDGLLVEAQDVGGFASAMATLADDDQKADALGRSGRVRALEDYGHERHMARLLATYDTALESARATKGNG
jgi:glycosyltransferase involved in cell wall biosynthesis